MKIKDVMKATGLTERTIRFYVEENLINPHTMLRNGREYRDYSKQDIEELMTIADLRKLFFSISEIKEMKNDQTKIAEVVATYQVKLKVDAEAKASIVQTLESINLSTLSDVNSLAILLRNVSANLPLPQRDIRPNFGKFDKETKEDRDREFNRFKIKQERQYFIGKVIVFTIATIHIISSIISAFIDFSFFSLLIQIILSIALFAGVTWVRYLFVAGAIISVIVSFILLTGGYVSEMTLGMVLMIIIQMIFAIVSSILLIISESVKEFLYSQKNG